jgi:UDP-N-acetyl-D-glucosamine dehydrogenase
MPKWVIEKAEIGLRGQGKEISGSKALILGMAYKKNVDDLRESPSFELIHLLMEKGSHVDYHDFYIPHLHKTRKYDFDLQSIKLDTINTYDLVILATDHDKYDYDLLQDNAKLIVDTRGKLDHNLENVISA